MRKHTSTSDSVQVSLKGQGENGVTRMEREPQLWERWRRGVVGTDRGTRPLLFSGLGERQMGRGELKSWVSVFLASELLPVPPIGKLAQLTQPQRLASNGTQYGEGGQGMICRGKWKLPSHFFFGLCFPNREIEAQNKQMICFMAHSTGIKPNISDSRNLVCSLFLVHLFKIKSTNRTSFLDPSPKNKGFYSAF